MECFAIVAWEAIGNHLQPLFNCVNYFSLRVPDSLAIDVTGHPFSAFDVDCLVTGVPFYMQGGTID